MNLVRTWNKNDYQEFLEYLKSLEEIKYKEFSAKLTTTKYEMLGIRLPLQRKIAKEICKGNIESFLKFSSNVYYEEVMIKGFVIASIKDKSILLQYLDPYVDMIDDWAVCDSFCNSLKIVNQDKEYWFSYFKSYLNSQEEFRTRVGIVVLLNFYVNEDYIDEILQLVSNIDVDKYYVNMGIAWLLCECFIKFREKTLKFLQKNNLNLFTFNKTISKIRESYRVSREDKDYLLGLKRRRNEKVKS